MVLKLLSQEKRNELKEFLGGDEEDVDYFRSRTSVCIEEFVDCCGAGILCGFPLRNKEDNPVDKRILADIILRIDYEFRKYNYPLVYAILNEYQMPHFKAIFKKFGGTQIHKPVVGFQKVKLYPWLFVRGIPRKTKRVFKR